MIARSLIQKFDLKAKSEFGKGIATLTCIPKNCLNGYEPGIFGQTFGSSVSNTVGSNSAQRTPWYYVCLSQGAKLEK